MFYIFYKALVLLFEKGFSFSFIYLKKELYVEYRIYKLLFHNLYLMYRVRFLDALLWQKQVNARFFRKVHMWCASTFKIFSQSLVNFLKWLVQLFLFYMFNFNCYMLVFYIFLDGDFENTWHDELFLNYAILVLRYFPYYFLSYGLGVLYFDCLYLFLVIYEESVLYAEHLYERSVKERWLGKAYRALCLLHRSILTFLTICIIFLQGLRSFLRRPLTYCRVYLYSYCIIRPYYVTKWKVHAKAPGIDFTVYIYILSLVWYSYYRYILYRDILIWAFFKVYHYFVFVLSCFYYGPRSFIKAPFDILRCYWWTPTFLIKKELGEFLRDDESKRTDERYINLMVKYYYRVFNVYVRMVLFVFYIFYFKNPEGKLDIYTYFYVSCYYVLLFFILAYIGSFLHEMFQYLLYKLKQIDWLTFAIDTGYSILFMLYIYLCLYASGVYMDENWDFYLLKDEASVIESMLAVAGPDYLHFEINNLKFDWYFLLESYKESIEHFFAARVPLKDQIFFYHYIKPVFILEGFFLWEFLFVLLKYPIFFIIYLLFTLYSVYHFIIASVLYYAGFVLVYSLEFFFYLLHLIITTLF